MTSSASMLDIDRAESDREIWPDRRQIRAVLRISFDKSRRQLHVIGREILGPDDIDEYWAFIEAIRLYGHITPIVIVDRHRRFALVGLGNILLVGQVDRARALLRIQQPRVIPARPLKSIPEDLLYSDRPGAGHHSV